MATAVSWHLRGDVMEACSCITTCPCNYGSDPTQVPCEAIIGWRIQEGQYGTTRLDGLHVVVYLQVPGHVFQGDWTIGMYLDQRANPQQVDALKAIFSGQAGGWPAAVSGLVAQQLPPQQVPIRFETVNGEHRISVPGLLEVGSERVPHPLPGQPPLDPKISDLAVPFYTGTAHVRQAQRLKLTDPHLSFEHDGRSCVIGQFEYRGP